MSSSDISAARRWFAEELRYVSRVRAPAVVAALANIRPRTERNLLAHRPWMVVVHRTDPRWRP